MNSPEGTWFAIRHDNTFIQNRSTLGCFLPNPTPSSVTRDRLSLGRSVQNSIRELRSKVVARVRTSHDTPSSVTRSRLYARSSQTRLQARSSQTRLKLGHPKSTLRSLPSKPTPSSLHSKLACGRPELRTPHAKPETRSELVVGL